jgi:hypothetical protein
MITIAIELNHVIRNINKQLLKYYQRDYNEELDIEHIDEKSENVLSKYIKFDSKKELNEFIYIDYPYEIFGCAKAMDKNLPRDITNWMEEMTNREDEEFRVIYYSLNEEALTIQSTYFFLSKLGTRVREVIFPKNIEEMSNKCDVIISSNYDVIKWAKKDGKIPVKITTNWKLEKDETLDGLKDDIIYSDMESVINDENFLDKLIELKK